MLSSHTNRGGDGPFDPASLGSPWGDRPSIYVHIERRIDPSSGSLVEVFTDLPDEPAGTGDEIRFAGGALDGIATHGFGVESEQDVAHVVYTQLVRVIKGRDLRAFNVLHGYLLEHSTLSYVDQLNLLLAQSMEELGGELAALGRHLLRHAADREVVKFAINLLGICGGVEDHSALLTIGAHDEFTLFAVVAMGHAGGDIRSTWEMAKRVDGWGRIQCIERLDKEIVDDDVRSWLLTEGYNTFVGTEYTAAICARRGGLREALDSAVLDPRLLDGAAEILAALARGNPGEGMDGYAESALATERFLTIIEQHESPKVQWLLASRDIERFLLSERGDGGGWAPDVRSRCSERAASIRSREVWHRVVAEGLRSEDDLQFNLAASAAEIIGDDPWEHRFVKLRSGKDQWYWLLETTDPRRLERVLEYAVSHIDLGAITSGYGNELGLSRNFAPHLTLDWILQALRRWPGHGVAFVDAGFRSPVVRNRSLAAQAALCWDPKSREPLLDAVRMLHAVEEREYIKDALERILAGECDPLEAERKL